MYDESLMLHLAGIQHYMFCPRQWALIHIEQLWDDNRLTAEGQQQHAIADDSFYRQMNQGIFTLRRVQLVSWSLGLYGFSDCIELKRAKNPANSIQQPGYPGCWIPYPIEYKHGRSKTSDCDRLQLMAQALCLEEMYGIKITEGALFYEETRRRERVTFTDELRNKTFAISEEMHRLYADGILPGISKSQQCRSCSLNNLCMPSSRRKKSVKNYLISNLYENPA